MIYEYLFSSSFLWCFFISHVYRLFIFDATQFVSCLFTASADYYSVSSASLVINKHSVYTLSSFCFVSFLIGSDMNILNKYNPWILIRLSPTS